MPEASSWPPPPNIAAVPAPHDAFLTICILTSSEKSILTRGFLLKELRRESGLGFWPCYHIVADFCDRQQILPLKGRAEVWLRGVLLVVVECPLFITVFYLLHSVFDLHTATTEATRMAIINRMVNILPAMLGTVAVVLSIIIPLAIYNLKRNRRATAHARGTLAEQATAQI